MRPRVTQQGKFQLLHPAAPFPEENSILGVIYGVLLLADMNAATPLGSRGRSVISSAQPFAPRYRLRHLLSWWRQARRYQALVSHLDLSRAPYVLYGVKYMDLVSLGAFVPRYFLFWVLTNDGTKPWSPDISYFVATFPCV